MKGSNTKTNETKVTYDVKVLRAKEILNDKLDSNVAIDIEVNGVKIYGVFFKEGTSKNGKEYSLLSFPSHSNGSKYFDYAWFPASKEVVADIREQIVALLK